MSEVFVLFFSLTAQGIKPRPLTHARKALLPLSYTHEPLVVFVFQDRVCVPMAVLELTL